MFRVHSRFGPDSELIGLVLVWVWSRAFSRAPLAADPDPPQNAAMKATHDETTFTLTGEIWSATYPLDELAKWLRWYRSRKARFPKAGNSYDATIAALEKLAAELGVTVPSD